RGGDEPRDHGRGTDAHRVPASDALRDDEGSGARRVRAGIERLIVLAVVLPGGHAMDDHIYRVIELTGSSAKSIEDAINVAIERAGTSRASCCLRTDKPAQ